jgi:ATP-dependent DNA helicase RecG
MSVLGLASSFRHDLFFLKTVIFPKSIMPRSIDSRLDFLSPVSLVPGLGPKRVAALHESGIDTIGRLLHHFPLRYVDRSTITAIADLPNFCNLARTVIGTITKTRVERGRKTRLRIQITDDSGFMEALWFHGVPFYRKTLHSGMRVLCTGVVKSSGFGREPFGGAVLMFHPMLEPIGEDRKLPEILFLPHYPLTLAMHEAHLQQKSLCKAIRWVLDNVKHWPQTLPDALEKKNRFPPLGECIREMHFPSELAASHRFRARLVYEELYRLAVTLAWNKRKFAQSGRSLCAGPLVDSFKKILPFALTKEQDQAVTTLLTDAKSPLRMHRLLQGDVGSGKTVTAFFACLPALNEGFQVAWLVPTEVLAEQAFSVLQPWCKNLGIAIDALRGGLAGENKKRILENCSSGRIQCIIGTHALLQPGVVFKKLGMIVIDEQHKFGAAQRLALLEKDRAADFLLMSATPIPQTLAQTAYGDLESVFMKGLPPGRLPVKTHMVPPTKRKAMEAFIRREILSKGVQAFWVVPRIEKDDEPDELSDAESVYDSLSKGVFNGMGCAMVHGRTDPVRQQRTMDEFKKGTVSVLVATTIIEVGVDAPNAAIMVIENAERFGLAQLHQLRGRIGRSSKQSYCFLCANDTENRAACGRLSYFCSHHDGFEIAEMDLQLRGPGEVLGWRQSGADDLVMADIITDAAVFKEILNEVKI